jgi:hypothetical protein
MWEFLIGFFIGRATGLWRYMRYILAIIAIGVLIAGFIYAIAVFHAVQERMSGHHVQHHSTR